MLSSAPRGPTDLTTETGEITDAGDGFEVRIPAARTSTVAAGSYRW